MFQTTNRYINFAPVVLPFIAINSVLTVRELQIVAVDGDEELGEPAAECQRLQSGITSYICFAAVYQPTYNVGPPVDS